MCLIGIKKKGAPLVDLLAESISVAYQSNRSGFGIALKRASSKTIWFKKGYDSLNDVLEDVRSLRIQKDDEFMFHGRVATFGTVNKANCHPFILGESIEDTGTIISDPNLKRPVMSHNGIISELSRGYGGKYSDTRIFVSKVFSGDEGKVNLELLKNDPFLLEVKYADWMTYGGKFAFLFPDRDLITIGRFVEDEKHPGYIFSHSGYKDRYYVDRGGVKTNYKNFFEDDVDEDTPTDMGLFGLAGDAATMREVELTSNCKLLLPSHYKVESNADDNLTEDDLASREFAEYVEKRYGVPNKYKDVLVCEIDELLTNAEPFKSEGQPDGDSCCSTNNRPASKLTGYNRALVRYNNLKMKSSSNGTESNIKIRPDNMSDFFLICNEDIAGFITKHYYYITGLGSGPDIFMVKDVIAHQGSFSRPIGKAVIEKYFTIAPRDKAADKYKDYFKLCEAYPHASKNLARRISRILSSNGKAVVNTKKVKNIHRDALIEFFKANLEHLITS